MASLVKLVCSCEPCRSRANDCHTTPSALKWGVGHHPAHLETPVNNSTLDRFYTHRLFIDAKHTGTFTWRRADTTSELREVVSHKQPVECVSPLVLKNEFIPLGNNIADGTASVGLAERHATVHTPRRLVL